jgi:hypothetical protein
MRRRAMAVGYPENAGGSVVRSSCFVHHPGKVAGVVNVVGSIRRGKSTTSALPPVWTDRQLP